MRQGLIAIGLMLLGAATTSAAGPAKHENARITEAATVINELRSAPDRTIPDNVWQRARCVAVLPGVKKAAFVLGGEFGRGVVSCRRDNGWSAPVFLTLEKGSFGAQIGAESTDVVLLIMNEQGLERLLQDKVTLGADASLAAGPVGRTGTAETDVQLKAEVLAYSRSRGLFAGFDLSGGVLKPDPGATHAFYGRAMTPSDVLLAKTTVMPPASARPLITALEGGPRHAAKHGV